jgi:hypothetical protein
VDIQIKGQRDRWKEELLDRLPVRRRDRLTDGQCNREKERDRYKIIRGINE